MTYSTNGSGRPAPSRRGAVHMNVGAEAVAFERAAAYLLRAIPHTLRGETRIGWRLAAQALRARSRDHLALIERAFGTPKEAA